VTSSQRLALALARLTSASSRRATLDYTRSHRRAAEAPDVSCSTASRQRSSAVWRSQAEAQPLPGLPISTDRDSSACPDFPSSPPAGESRDAAASVCSRNGIRPWLKSLLPFAPRVALSAPAVTPASVEASPLRVPRRPFGLWLRISAPPARCLRPPEVRSPRVRNGEPSPSRAASRRS
jgi:hypothetical protein